MKISHPFVVEILNKIDTHPLQAASNYSGEKMVELTQGPGGGYSPPKRQGIVALNDIILPTKDSIHGLNLPEFLQIRKGARAEVIRNTRNTLWLRVDWRETRANAQFARLFQLALPTEIDVQRAREAMTLFAEKELVSVGMVADLSIHESRELNSFTQLEAVLSRTGYLMCTTRPFEDGKFINKNRQWNDRAQLLAWRKSWFETLREFLPAPSEPTISQSSRDLWKFTQRFSGSPTVSIEPTKQEALISDPVEPTPIQPHAQRLRL